MLFQDPVYGKGKLAEIQGLILGMLDTFNYEQVKLSGAAEGTSLETFQAVADVVFPLCPLIVAVSSASDSAGNHHQSTEP